MCRIVRYVVIKAMSHEKASLSMRVMTPLSATLLIAAGCRTGAQTANPVHMEFRLSSTEQACCVLNAMSDTFIF